MFVYNIQKMIYVDLQYCGTIPPSPFQSPPLHCSSPADPVGNLRYTLFSGRKITRGGERGIEEGVGEGREQRGKGRGEGAEGKGRGRRETERGRGRVFCSVVSNPTLS